MSAELLPPIAFPQILIVGKILSLAKRLRKRFSLRFFNPSCRLAIIRILAGKRRIMLKGIPSFLNADLLWALAAMGHGDELAIVDRNFSADRVARKTSSGKLFILSGIDAPIAIGGILQLMPLDTFVESPVSHMTSVDHPAQILDVHHDVISVCSKVERRNIVSRPIERMAYYPLAMSCFAVVQTGEDRPYANFILKKGVVST
jgi:L-fucose mutarotase